MEHYQTMARDAAAFAYQGRACSVVQAAIRDLTKAVKGSTMKQPAGLMFEGDEYIMPQEVMDELRSLVQTIADMYGTVVNDLPTVIAAGPRWLTAK